MKEQKNIIDKVWALHLVEANAGFPDLLAIDCMLIHEVTSAQAFTALRERGLSPFAPERLFATLDHSVPTRSDRFRIIDDIARHQVESLRENCNEFGIRLFDFGSTRQGIVHVIGPELGVIHPGMTVVCGDSHTSTHGAFGALGFGIGSTEVGYVMATSALLLSKPKTMKVHFSGELRNGATAKDMNLKLISEIGVGGANGHIIEYCGTAIDSMSMEERMTICNMSIECGARAGVIAPDETTIKYLKGRTHAPKDFEEAISFWLSLRSDPGCSYDTEIEIDLNKMEPMVTWGTNPSQAVSIRSAIPDPTSFKGVDSEAAKRALAYHGLNAGTPMQEIDIDWAFIGSCTNGRIEDLRVAANILSGKKVHPSVTMYIVPGSESVRAQAIAEGLDKIFSEAGADFRMPGCSMCLGMNDDQVPHGKRCISSSNRNFIGRQGAGSFTHLASPATVAASAITGKITPPEYYETV